MSDHDPKCPKWFAEDDQISCPTCDLIISVRRDTLDALKVERKEWWLEGYASAMTKTRKAIMHMPNPIDSMDLLPIIDTLSGDA